MIHGDVSPRLFQLGDRSAVPTCKEHLMSLLLELFHYDAEGERMDIHDFRRALNIARQNGELPCVHIE